MRVIRYAANDVNIGKANEEVVDFLKQHKVNHHLVFEYQLLIEEILIKLVEKAPMGAEFEISASFARGHCTFMITCAGAPVDLFYHDSLGSIILDEYSERISQNYSKNKNRIKLSTHVSSNSLMINSCVAVLAAVLVSLVFRYIVPDNITLYLEGQLIFPLMNVFTMLMETFAYPLAFLSIVAYIVSFRMQIDGNREISNMAIKHTLTSIIGLIIGGAVGSVARFIPEIYDMTEFRTRTNNFMGEDLAEVIGNAVPSNMVEPFTGSSSLPVLLLAVIFGIAASSYFGRGGDFIRELISGAAGLMGTVINITYSLMPIIVFLAVLSGIIDFGYKILVFLIVTLFAFIFALALMVAVQSVPQA